MASFWFILAIIFLAGDIFLFLVKNKVFFRNLHDFLSEDSLAGKKSYNKSHKE